MRSAETDQDMCPFSGLNMDRNQGILKERRQKQKPAIPTYRSEHHTYIQEHTKPILNQPISTNAKISGCVKFTKPENEWKVEFYETNEQTKTQHKVFDMGQYAGGLQNEVLRKNKEIEDMTQKVRNLESQKNRYAVELEELNARIKVLEGYRGEWLKAMKLDNSTIKQPASSEQKSSGKSNTLYKRTNGKEENRDTGRLVECDNRFHAKNFSRQVQPVPDDKIQIRCSSCAFDENIRCQVNESERTIEDLQKVIKDLESQVQNLQQEKTYLEKTVPAHKERLANSANFTGRNNKEDKSTSIDDFQQNQHNIPKGSVDYQDQSVSASKKKNAGLGECEENIQHQEKKTIDLQNENHNLEKRIRHLELTNARLEKKNVELKQMSDKITQKLAGKLDSGECFESVNDSFANSKIAQKLKSLYDDDWVKLFMFLRKAFPKMHELDRIKKLSYLIKCCNQECVKMADKQTRMILFSDETGRLPGEDKIREMLAHRKKISQMDFVRNNVTKNVLEIILSTDEVKQLCGQDSGEQMKEKLRTFFAKLIDGCWLVAISFPTMILNFDVVGQQFKDCEERWTEFSTKKPVEDTSVNEGTIIEVVWPSVELRDGTACYTKGDAIVVKKGISKKNK